MNIGIILIIIAYALLGGVSSLVLIGGIPVVLVWKFYRKITHNISIMK